MYDPYVRAIRLASDRVQNSANGGIVAFVTNGGFIDSNAFDGVRKAVAREFNVVYCFNLRGDARTAGDKRQREGGGIFSQESRAGVAILLLVKKPVESSGATIYYQDIGDYLSREAKLEILGGSHLSATEWQTITPNEHGDWINQRSDVFQSLRPLALMQEETVSSTKENGTTGIESTPIFNLRTPGLKTARDAWCYNSSEAKLRSNIASSVDYYNGQTRAFRTMNPIGSRRELEARARAFSVDSPSNFHWCRENYRDLANGTEYEVSDTDYTTSTYRPFFKQRLCFNRKLNSEIRRLPEIYPNPAVENLGISITGPASNSPFFTLMTSDIPESCLTAVNSVYLARWCYASQQKFMQPMDPDTPELIPVSNINPAALTQFREHHGDTGISEDDLFYYTYGILHSQQWREKFADDLTKSAARIPMVATVDDFQSFVTAGLELAALHINYETVEPYPLVESYGSTWNPKTPDAYRVERMAYAGSARYPDKSAIVCNAHITLSGIPEQAHEYRLGTRSALDWLIDRYQVRTDKTSGIVNDPNDWVKEHEDPRYIVDLVKRVTKVSVRTVEIVRNLPYLRFDDGDK